MSLRARYNSPNLCELIIHQQDVRRALGIERAVPAEQVAWPLDYAMTRVGNIQAGGRPRGRAAGLRLVATDIGWSTGSGPDVSGPGEALLLASTGRTIAAHDLAGPGVDALMTRTRRGNRTTTLSFPQRVGVEGLEPPTPSM